MRMSKKFLLGANVVVITALAICYVQLLVFVLAKLALNFPPAVSSLEKMAHSGTSILVAGAVIFAANAFVTRQNMLRLGQACGLAAFVWFYIIRAENISTVGLVFASFLSLYSAFALLASTLGPVAVGAFLNRRKPVHGFLTLCHVG